MEIGGTVISLAPVEPASVELFPRIYSGPGEMRNKALRQGLPFRAVRLAVINPPQSAAT